MPFFSVSSPIGLSDVSRWVVIVSYRNESSSRSISFSNSVFFPLAFEWENHIHVCLCLAYVASVNKRHFSIFQFLFHLNSIQLVILFYVSENGETMNAFGHKITVCFTFNRSQINSTLENYWNDEKRMAFFGQYLRKFSIFFVVYLEVNFKFLLYSEIAFFTRKGESPDREKWFSHKLKWKKNHRSVEVYAVLTKLQFFGRITSAVNNFQSRQLHLL